MKSRKRWAENAARMGIVRNAYIFDERLKEGSHLEDLKETLILRLILKN
jgi:hypothetical protein